MKIGILPLGRPTFDVPFAEEKLGEMLTALGRCNHEIVGTTTLLFDVAAAESALADLGKQAIDRLLILQVTFTDAEVAVLAGTRFDIPLSIWAVPEPRLGGRLRLNAFCGLNLASHALGLNNRRFSWLYADPAIVDTKDIQGLVSADNEINLLQAEHASCTGDIDGGAVVKSLRGKRIGRIGRHPEGFDTCAYSPTALEELSGVKVDELELDQLFETAKSVTAEAAGKVHAIADANVVGLDKVDQVELDKSLRLKVALDKIRASGPYDAFAIRCWPETFTEYGGAVCGPVSMLGEEKVPCACEADVYGALTQLILQESAQAPVFLTDLVDLDAADNTGVVWHCGQAPISMRQEDIEATATIHTNRKMPLLYEFPLKAGRVTFMRISQAFGQPKMILASGEMLERPMAFTGTSGVIQFDRTANDVLADVMACGMEHHMALTYGEHRPLLRSVAAAMNLPVLEL